jgi:hypothetical protein
MHKKNVKFPKTFSKNFEDEYEGAKKKKKYAL